MIDFIFIINGLFLFQNVQEHELNNEKNLFSPLSDMIQQKKLTVVITLAGVE